MGHPMIWNRNNTCFIDKVHIHNNKPKLFIGGLVLTSFGPWATQLQGYKKFISFLSKKNLNEKIQSARFIELSIHPDDIN